MKFVLNEYHRNISEEELLKDLKQAAQRAEKDSITCAEYNAIGSFHSSTFAKRFGSWNEALRRAGLSINHVQGYDPRYVQVTNEELLSDIRMIADKLCQNYISGTQYDENSIYNSALVISRSVTICAEEQRVQDAAARNGCVQGSRRGA